MVTVLLLCVSRGREKLYWVPFFEIWQKFKNAAAKKSALYHSN